MAHSHMPLNGVSSDLPLRAYIKNGGASERCDFNQIEKTVNGTYSSTVISLAILSDINSAFFHHWNTNLL